MSRARQRISVVIPSYQGFRTLPETLLSLRAQTRRPDQVIVVDDGSKDPRALALLSRLPKWVELLRQENAGPGPARNAGIARSDGALVLVLDDDDRLRRDALALLERALEEEPGASFAYGHVRYFGAQRGTAVVPRFNGYLESIDNRLLPCALFRRAVFAALGLRYPPRTRSGSYEDWSLWLDCAARGLRGAVVEAPIFLYRRKREGGVLRASHAIRAELIADLRAAHPALYSAEGRARLKQRDAPSLELALEGGTAADEAAARALLAAQGLPDVRFTKSPATARALLHDAGGKYLLLLAPAEVALLARSSGCIAFAMQALEAAPGAAWARLEPDGDGDDADGAPVLLRLHALDDLLERDLAAGAPPRALADVARRLGPGLALSGDPMEWPALAAQPSAPGAGARAFAGAGASSHSRNAAAEAALRAAWKTGRAAVERIAGPERVGRALHPLKLALDELRPALRGLRAAIEERRVPRGLRRLVPASVREERTMLDAIPPGTGCSSSGSGQS